MYYKENQKAMKWSFTMVLAFAMSMAFMSLNSCYSDAVADSPEIPLHFSVDTLTFDTVFTAIGSATRSFKIFNDLDEAVIINSLRLDNPSTSFFRLNADGIPTKDITDLRIEPLDSIYIFAEVTVDPDMPLSVSPFVIEEYVNITANQSSYRVLLQAFGQNANYVRRKEDAGELYELPCPLGRIEWNDPRPYVIYGAMFVDNCELIIPEGQQVYVHGGIAINDIGIYNDGIVVILENGKLTANGTLENPITIQTDRLEENFQDDQGQWAGIIFSQQSKGNVLKHTTIKHSIVGVSVDSTAELRIENCTFAHTSGSGISASNATILCENSLFYDNGGNGLSLNYGGDYTFNHCTIANYDNQDQALFMNNVKCVDPECNVLAQKELKARFTNCIFVGNDDDEIALLDITDGMQPEFFDYQLENSIVIVDELIDADNYPFFFNNCTDCENISRLDSLFLNLEEFDLHLDTMSIAIDIGKVTPLILDKDGNSRVDLPDVGCFEFQK